MFCSLVVFLCFLHLFGVPNVVYQDRLLGPSWVRALLNALQITVEERLLALRICLQRRDDRLDTHLKNGPFFTSKLTTAWHHGMAHALLKTRLHPFESPFAMEEERASLKKPT